jgi:hypothetical protein
MATSSLATSISSLAFIDDTNWITNSQQDLEFILGIAEEFYDLTRSALNKDKSKLLTIKSVNTATIPLKFGSTTINIESETGSVRFLGV